MNRAGGLIPLLALLLCIGGGQAGPGECWTEIGPFNEVCFWDVPIAIEITNTCEEEKDRVQAILDQYYLTLDYRVGDFDCSNIAEIDWRVLEEEGYDCDIVCNSGYREDIGHRALHMFVWVKTDWGVIVVEPCYGPKRNGHVGTVVYDPPQFYLQGWRWEDPASFTARKSGEMFGWTKEMPISYYRGCGRIAED